MQPLLLACCGRSAEGSPNVDYHEEGCRGGWRTVAQGLPPADWLDAPRTSGGPLAVSVLPSKAP
jgi:hypothetical protein